MATRQQIVDAADAQLATLWNVNVANREATFFAANGKYAQALVTHSVGLIPADGAAVVPDVGTAVPSYQAANTAWPSAIRTASLKFALAIHEYVRPDGVAGYVGLVYVLVLGHLVMRAQDSGPENFRTIPWTDMGVWPPVSAP